jgi:hypothetical protein
MKFLVLLFLCSHALAQFSSSTTTKVDVIKNNATSNVTLSPSGDVILSPATANKLIYTDIDKKLKSTSYDPDDVVVKDPISGEVLINGYLNLVSTTKGSVSCPVMTEAQRDLIATPALGECVFNSSSETLNLYDGTTWKSAGGGISQWVTAFNYAINDIVVYAGEIYQALTAHTSTVFLTDLGNGDWVKIADTIQAKGLNQSTETFKTIVAPNNQVTSIGSNQALIETRNTNLLINPSFEHSTYDTGWTCTGTGTESGDSSIFIDGAASKKVVTSSQTMDCVQTSALYAAQVAGVQGVVTAWIKSTSAIAQVCAVVDSVDVKCVTIESNNTWKEYVIPFVMGSTNNGIRVKSASDSATTYIDNAFVGVMPATMMPEISQAELVGSLTMTSCNNAGWANATTSYTTPVNTGCVYTASGDVLAPTTQTYGFRINNVKAGTYFIASSGAMLRQDPAAASSGASARWTDGTNTYPAGGAFVGVPQQVNTPFPQPATFTYANSASSVSINMQLAAFVAGGGARIEPDALAAKIVFHVYYYPPKSKIYSGDTIYPHAQLYGTLTYAAIANCTWSVTSTSFINFPADTDCPTPTVTGNLIAPATKIPAFVLPAGAPKGTYKIVSRGGFGGGASGGRLQYLRFSDGTNVTTSGIIYMSNTIANLPEASGQFTYDSPLITNTTIQAQGSSSSGAMDIYNGSTGSMALTFEVYYFPPKDNPIIGTFEGIEKCANDFECTDVFSATVSGAGVVTNENLDWINGNCVVSGSTIKTCTYISGLVSNPMNCVATVFNATVSVRIDTNTRDQVSVETAGSAAPFRIICQKQGSDYKPKTAKAATTNEMMYVPNVTRPKTCYYAFGGASATLASPTECTTGTCVEVYDSCSAGSAPTRSGTGSYSDMTFANGTWKASTFIYCTCRAFDTTSGQLNDCNQYFVTSKDTWSTNSSGGATLVLYVTTETGTPKDSYVSVNCTADAP